MTSATDREEPAREALLLPEEARARAALQQVVGLATPAAAVRAAEVRL